MRLTVEYSLVYAHVHAFMRPHGWPRHGHRLLAYAPVRQFPS
ncbi:hypothetical protein HMPREF0742_00547 [Rothia aeria F0184]|uniref:Uncharacterized protein n=2 Tax=Rothia aeria TaxID=172042 RepID=U7V6H7_9MICC|nr:hypothetical protein HMPREF1324_1313 [Rothia aeria F0474]ERT67135.1 hypothetical protein HMPREF0742_00547 [Rothia aeria F0184]